MIWKDTVCLTRGYILCSTLADSGSDFSLPAVSINNVYSKHYDIPSFWVPDLGPLILGGFWLVSIAFKETWAQNLRFGES